MSLHRASNGPSIHERPTFCPRPTYPGDPWSEKILLRHALTPLRHGLSPHTGCSAETKKNMKTCINKTPNTIQQNQHGSQNTNLEPRKHAGWLRLWQAVYPSTPPPQRPAPQPKFRIRIVFYSALGLLLTGCQVLTYTSPNGERFTRSSFGANTSIS